MKNSISKHYNESLKVITSLGTELPKIEKISEILVNKIKSKKNIFVYGNGGSYADSSHFVGELTSTYLRKNRKALPFFLLSSNLAALTAWSNDFEFEDYLKREFSIFAKKSDVLILFSTSGGNIKRRQSVNLIKLAKYAKKKNIFIISFLGKGGGFLKKISNLSIDIKSQNTGSIQEAHKVIMHSICSYFDELF
jgi:D-sedoheptulose 7-phosphate isomerase